MDFRDTALLALRPELPNAQLLPGMSADEHFQNKTLRPIAKLQNDLLLAVFQNYCRKHKNVFQDLSISKRMDYIENAIHKDMKFRNSLKGVIIGQFTLAEYEAYTANSSALNKRMMNIVKERLKSQIQLFGPSLEVAWKNVRFEEWSFHLFQLEAVISNQNIRSLHVKYFFIN